jgi:hypothetical protein
MWGRSEKASGVNKGGPKPAPARVAAHPDPSEALVCCGRPMEPRLTRARDRYGQTLFVAVWQCVRCGRSSV